MLKYSATKTKFLNHKMILMYQKKCILLLCFTFLLAGNFVYAQSIDPSSFSFLRWRMIGPYRGGRTVGSSGDLQHPNVFYIGVNNGGVWKTDDYGRTWNPIFDDQPTGSIGDVAVAPSNPNTIYVASGEGLQRPDLSVGNGMYKSQDAGKTWQHIGLSKGLQTGYLRQCWAILMALIKSAVCTAPLMAAKHGSRFCI